MSRTEEFERGAREERARQTPSKRVATAAARALLAADKKRGVASSEATRQLAAGVLRKAG